MQREYIAEINKCAVLRIDPLNPDNYNDKVNCRLLQSLIFLHKQIFKSNGSSTFVVNPLQERNCHAKKSLLKTSKLYKDIMTQSTQNSKMKNQVLERQEPRDVPKILETLEKENCLQILNVRVLDIPAGSLRTKYFLECSSILRDLRKRV